MKSEVLSHDVPQMDQDRPDADLEQAVEETHEGGSCRRNPMPHELRMLYCSHYRKRRELEALRKKG